MSDKIVTSGTVATISDINRERHEAIARMAYDPLAGNPSDPQRRLVTRGIDRLYLPLSMLDDTDYTCTLPQLDFDRLRFRHDFEFWAATCVHIISKDSKQSVPFVLNRAQRRLLGALERQRLAGVPIRLILLKARQWGASTLVQIYFAWIQIVHLHNWHSLICAHVKDTAATIRGMYSHLLARYPVIYWGEGGKEDGRPELRPFERMTNVRVIPSRGCRVAVCSSENQEAMRGMDCSMAHLSEVAFWKDSPQHNPVDLIRSVTSGISRTPMTVVVMESTANGVGNYFHREWQRAVGGKSDKTPFFVAWHELDDYSEPVDNPEAFFASFDDYERELWDTHGCTLEAIRWYRSKASEYPDRRSLMAEFPTTPDEAFSATDSCVFSSADITRLRDEGCRVEPRLGEVLGSRHGIPSDLSSPRFQPSPQGYAKVWTRPRQGGDYIVSVDIGGRSRDADYSVICVLDRHTDSAPGAIPEIVAQWRGHIDHDLLAWRAAAMARWYNNALLVIESNSWESSADGSGQYILDTLASVYPRLYHRRGDGGKGRLPGFHTNVRTKSAIIANMIAMVRDGTYIERDADACDEMMQYEVRPDGSYGARRGCHDDILMSRAIALWVHASAHTVTPRLSREAIDAILSQ